MSKKSVRISVKGAKTVSYKKIKDFQGELRTVSEEALEQLKTEIKDRGFNSPIHVWASGKTLYNLDGHQRVAALHALESEGYSIPAVPVDLVEAKNIKEAKHILLSRVSQYGKTSPQGLYKFMADANMPMDEVKASFSIPGLNMGQFERDFFHPPNNKVPQGSQEVNESEISSKLLHKCPKCGFQFIKGIPSESKF